MWKWIFFAPLLLFAQELEVALPTRSTLKPLYLSSPHEETRSILEFDFKTSGSCIVVPKKEQIEEALHLTKSFDLPFWKREGLAFCIVANVSQDQLEATVFNIEQGTSKKYPPLPLKREAIHRLADAIQKDLFGKEGIASLKLLYTQRVKNKSKEGLDFLSEVWICDSDGANAEQITKENSYCLCPSFLPQLKNAFFYASEKSGQSKIYRASFSHSTAELLIDMRGNQALPAISKNGQWLAFISDIAGRPDLFVQHLDSQAKALGKPRQLFTAPRATQASPTFSPDGKKIAFVSDKDGSPRIYVLNVESKTPPKPELITLRHRENTSPAWSDDGKKLAYSAKVDGIRQIWLYDFETQEEMALTSGNENKENPAWAHDSLHLIYNTETEGKCELYLIDLNQKQPIQISQGPSQKRFASWQQRYHPLNWEK